MYTSNQSCVTSSTINNINLRNKKIPCEDDKPLVLGLGEVADVAGFTLSPSFFWKRYFSKLCIPLMAAGRATSGRLAN